MYDNDIRVFATEFQAIKDRDVRAAVQDILRHRTPPYFYALGASPSGRFHPPDEHGEGGLVLHTRRVFWLAHDLCDAWRVEGRARDLVLSATLVHDIYVRGFNSVPTERTVEGHADLLFDINNDLTGPDYRFLRIASAHNGRWGNVHLVDRLDEIMHVSDFIASRRHVSVDVEGYRREQDLTHV